MCGNCYDKVKVVNYLCNLNDLKINEEVAYIGDDDNDIEIMKQVAIAGCPSNASNNAKLQCQFISKYKGGDGAVRDFIEYIFEQSR
jgi:3-deoxy-D-manno-octulosonate 8-phosphate phosphatase (KDO 8-P phosphatase)